MDNKGQSSWIGIIVFLIVLVILLRLLGLF